MKYIEYISKTGKYSKLGFTHSVFVKDQYVLSYEMSAPLQGGIFHIHNKKDWIKNVGEIIFTKDIPDINILEYEGIKHEGINCFQALNAIYPIPTNKKRMNHIFLWILIFIVYGYIMFIIGYFLGLM